MKKTNPLKLILLFIIFISTFLISCKKTSNNNSSNNNSNSSSGSNSIIAHIYNSDGSLFYSDTFAIIYLGDQCIESYTSAGWWNYYALTYNGDIRYKFLTKNKIAIKSYTSCVLPTSIPSNDNQFSIQLREGGTINYPYSYYAKTGILNISNITTASDMFGTGIRISGNWTGIAGVETSSGNYYEKQAELIINNMLYYN